MPKFENVGPLGALDLPLVGRVVAPGEVIEVTDEQAKHLNGQDAVWRPVQDTAPSRTRTTRNAPQSGADAGESTTGEEAGA